MPVSKKQQACVNRYNSKAYDRINLMVRKGSKELIKEHAERCGESTNAFINRAIDETIARDQAKSEEGGQ